MHRFVRSIAVLAVVACVVCALPSLHAQSALPYDAPKKFVAKQPPTRQELEERDSLHLYVRGLLLEREERFTKWSPAPIRERIAVGAV